MLAFRLRLPTQFADGSKITYELPGILVKGVLWGHRCIKVGRGLRVLGWGEVGTEEGHVKLWHLGWAAGPLVHKDAFDENIYEPMVGLRPSVCGLHTVGAS